MPFRMPRHPARSLAAKYAPLILLGIAANLPASAAEITTTFSVGITGNWNNPANWDAGVPNNGFNTYNAVIPGNSTLGFPVTWVDLDMDAAILRLSTAGNSRVDIDNGHSLTVTQDGLWLRGTAFESSLFNAGVISLNSTGSVTELVLSKANGMYQLRGSGHLRMFGSDNNRIVGAPGSTSSNAANLINIDNQISGYGQIGAKTLILDNRGTITGQGGSGATLVIDAVNGALSSNTGVLRSAVNSTLELRSTQLLNQSGDGSVKGVIRAGGSGTVRLNDFTVIHGGNLETLSGGTLLLDKGTSIQSGAAIDNFGTTRVKFGGASLDAEIKNSSLDNTGEAIVDAKATLALDTANITNNSGTIRLNGAMTSSNAGSNLSIGGSAVTLSGGGDVALSQADDNAIRAASGGSLINQDNTIHGAGTVSALTINRGTVDADQALAANVIPQPGGSIDVVAGGTLAVGSSGTTLVNRGTMQATAGRLRIDGDVQNFEGFVSGNTIANNASVRISSGSTVTGGKVNVLGAGRIDIVGGSVVDGVVINSASGEIHAGGSSAVLGGTVFNPTGGKIVVDNLGTLRLLGGAGNSYQNSGNIELNSTAFLTTQLTKLLIDGDVTLAGGGNLILKNDKLSNQVLGTGATADRLVNSNHTISGSGKLGMNNLELRNLGTIHADGAFNALTIDVAGTSFTNEGTLRASGAAGLALDDALAVNTGAVQVTAGSNLTAAGTYRQTAGSTTLAGGTLNASGIEVLGGSFLGNGTVNGPISFGAGSQLGPGASPGILNFGGDASFAGTIAVEIAGVQVDSGVPNAAIVNTATDPATTQFDQINTFGQATLAAGLNIDVSLLGGFDPLVDSFFDVMTADSFLGDLSLINLILPTLTGDRVFETALVTLFDPSQGKDRQALRLSVASTLPPPTTGVPEPDTLPLLGAALFALAALRRRRERRG